jgi:hypothetical protein
MEYNDEACEYGLARLTVRRPARLITEEGSGKDDHQQQFAMMARFVSGVPKTAVFCCPGGVVSLTKPALLWYTSWLTQDSTLTTAEW